MEKRIIYIVYRKSNRLIVDCYTNYKKMKRIILIELFILNYQEFIQKITNVKRYVIILINTKVCDELDKLSLVKNLYEFSDDTLNKYKPGNDYQLSSSRLRLIKYWLLGGGKHDYIGADLSDDEEKKMDVHIPTKRLVGDGGKLIRSTTCDDMDLKVEKNKIGDTSNNASESDHVSILKKDSNMIISKKRMMSGATQANDIFNNNHSESQGENKRNKESKGASSNNMSNLKQDETEQPKNKNLGSDDLSELNSFGQIENTPKNPNQSQDLIINEGLDMVNPTVCNDSLTTSELHCLRLTNEMRINLDMLKMVNFVGERYTIKDDCVWIDRVGDAIGDFLTNRDLHYISKFTGYEYRISRINYRESPETLNSYSYFD